MRSPRHPKRFTASMRKVSGATNVPRLAAQLERGAVWCCLIRRVRADAATVAAPIA